MKNTSTNDSIKGMVKMTCKNIPVASHCKVIKADGSVTYIEPMESKCKSDNYTKIGGKPKNRDFIKENDWN